MRDYVIIYEPEQYPAVWINMYKDQEGNIGPGSPFETKLEARTSALHIKWNNPKFRLVYRIKLTLKG